MGFIDREQLLAMPRTCTKSGYGEYLVRLAAERPGRCRNSVDKQRAIPGPFSMDRAQILSSMSEISGDCSRLVQAKPIRSEVERCKN